MTDTAVMADPATTSRFALPPDVPPRPERWRSTDGCCRLEELTHPCHLLAEGREMKHCIGHYYADNPQLYGLEPGEPAASPLLAYWQAIEDGACRIFSFAKGPRTLATLNVANDLGSPVLRELAAKYGHRINGGEPYFAALMAAIDSLSGIVGAKVELSPRFWHLKADHRPPPRPSGEAPENKAAAQFKLRQCCRAIECPSYDTAALFIALMSAVLSRRPSRQVLADFSANPASFGPLSADATRAEIRRCGHALAWVLWFDHAARLRR